MFLHTSMGEKKIRYFFKYLMFNGKNTRAKILANLLDKLQSIEFNLSREFVNILAFES